MVYIKPLAHGRTASSCNFWCLVSPKAIFVVAIDLLSVSFLGGLTFSPFAGPFVPFLPPIVSSLVASRLVPYTSFSIQAKVLLQGGRRLVCTKRREKSE